ncbi:hypothetical protein Fmac_026966 [Flemingia macrophylla]|uniref:Uncharacterized protein n=1 Tax=Flemingia macrophylla TaxID=520843 RepID=A0ABD1LGB8_9FABA
MVDRHLAEVKNKLIETSEMASSGHCEKKQKSLSKTTKPSSSSMEKKKKNLPSSNYFEKKQKSLQKPTKCSSSSTQKRKKKIKSNNSCKDTKLPTWVTDWIMCPKERKDGRIDKMYRHKEKDMTFRSLKEVERYEFDGILPQRYRKANGRGKMKEKMCGNGKTSPNFNVSEGLTQLIQHKNFGMGDVRPVVVKALAACRPLSETTAQGDNRNLESESPDGT